MQAEFDQYADDYEAQHRASIGASGEEPAYFARYKIAALQRLLPQAPTSILDFGSGVGNSTPHFRAFYPQASLTLADPSERSLQMSKARNGGDEAHVQIIDDRLPVADGSFDLVFTACVLHHIPEAQHDLWLRETLRAARPGGALVIFEHNPLNPLTVRAVKACPFDADAVLMRAGVLAARVEAAGWRDARVRYQVFFPNALRALRPLEPYLGHVPMGAQYAIVARKT